MTIDVELINFDIDACDAIILKLIVELTKINNVFKR